jgi:hypothetical protein
VKAELKCEAVAPLTQVVICIADKVCPRCKASKSANEFGVDNNRKSGVNPVCKACLRSAPRSPGHNAANRRYRARLKARHEVTAPNEKRCCSCRQTKPSSEYHANRAAPDGLALRCKACKSAEHHRRRVAMSGRTIAVVDKTCIICVQTKPAECFYKQTTAKDGLHPYCIDCAGTKGRTYYAGNRERIILANWKYAKANPEIDRSGRISSRSNARAASVGSEGTFSPKEWRDLVTYFGQSCAYCTRHESVVGKLTADHVTPLSRGGTGYIDNILPACLSCNATKGDKTLLEFLLWKTEMVKIFGEAA